MPALFPVLEISIVFLTYKAQVYMIMYVNTELQQSLKKIFLFQFRFSFIPYHELITRKTAGKTSGDAREVRETNIQCKRKSNSDAQGKPDHLMQEK